MHAAARAVAWTAARAVSSISCSDAAELSAPARPVLDPVATCVSAVLTASLPSAAGGIKYSVKRQQSEGSGFGVFYKVRRHIRSPHVKRVLRRIVATFPVH